MPAWSAIKPTPQADGGPLVLNGASCTTGTDCWVALGFPSILGPLDHDIPLGLWNGSSFSESTLQVKGFLAGISYLAENGGTWCIALGEAPTAKADNTTMIGGDFLIARPGLEHGSRKPAASQARLTARTTPRSTSLRRFYCSQPAMLGATGPRGGPGRAFCP